MEDILELYMLLYNRKYPVVCIDEKSQQLTEETREPRPARPGMAALRDCEYARKGTGNIFMMFEPLASIRETMVSERRTKKDFAACLRYVAETMHPDADKIVLVMDNLNTHRLSSLHAAYDAETAKRLEERFEIHYTPKHGSWLNMAEIEIGVMGRQCLGRRIGTLEKLESEVRAWTAQRNSDKATVRWQFTAADARIKLQHLYPRI